MLRILGVITDRQRTVLLTLSKCGCGPDGQSKLPAAIVAELRAMPLSGGTLSDTPKKNGQKYPDTFLRFLPDDHLAYRNTSWTVFIPMRVRVKPVPEDDQAPPEPQTPKQVRRRTR